MSYQILEVQTPRRRPAVQIINTMTPAIETRSPDDAVYSSPRFHKLHRRASYGLERRSTALVAPRTVRSAVTYTHDDTQEELARYYQQQARQLEHRPKHRHDSRDDYALALVPVNRGGELVKHAKPIVLQREPVVQRSKSEKKREVYRQLRIEPAVVERKQVKYLRDTAGDWVRVRKVVR